MGWYHATQILDETRGIGATLDHVVEPWYLSEKAIGAPGSKEFAQFKSYLENKGVKFYAQAKDVPPSEPGKKRLAIISSRTQVNPTLFEEILPNTDAIFLEKPGAETVSELEQMKESAEAKNVPVYMGFNKNVSKYSTKARKLAEAHPGSKITYIHNNNYENTPASLGECFERNSEGILKNMAIHELALAATFHEVSVDSVQSVTADKDYSSMETLKGPSGNNFTDFSKIKFGVTTKSGIEVIIAADRCGGDDSVGVVSDAAGEELGRFSMPDEEDAETIKRAAEKEPGSMPYFFVQDPDYLALKQRVVNSVTTGEDADGVATIGIAVDSLKLAEYLTPILKEQLE